MVTIVGGMLVGMRPRQAAEFSFLLGLPTLGGACVYSAYKNFTHDGSNMIDTLGVSAIVIGIIVATVSAAIAVKWLVSFLARHGLAVFGWYRIALCAALGLLIWRGVITIEPEIEGPANSMNKTSVGAEGAAHSSTFKKNVAALSFRRRESSELDKPSGFPPPRERQHARRALKLLEAASSI